jgi:hypothetical protein
MATNNSVNASTSGIQSLTPAGVYNGRTITAGTGISVTNGDGISGNPTISATGASVSTATLNLYDDFTSYFVPTTSTLMSNMYWQGTLLPTAAAGVASTESGHIGIIQNVSSASSLGMFSAPAGVTTGTLLLGGGIITLNWIFKITALSNATIRYTLRFGLGDTATTSATTPANAVYFEYSDNLNSGNWNYNTASASSITTTNSATAVTTGWHNAQITINAAASSVNFTMDGVSLGNVTATIPTTVIAPRFDFNRNAGTPTTGLLIIDAFYLTETFTTPR